jgi:hypothetical protein
MMPVIRIGETTHLKLQKLAIPLVDNADSLISRLADAALAGVPFKMEVNAPTQDTSETQTPALEENSKHPDLVHTKVKYASFNGREIDKPNWNKIAKIVHEYGFSKMGSFHELSLVTNARLKQGSYDKEGFVYLASAGFSMQGMDSNSSWDNCLRIAKKLNVPIKVIFEWYDKPSVARPGESDTLEWMP